MSNFNNRIKNEKEKVYKYNIKIDIHNNRFFHLNIKIKSYIKWEPDDQKTQI